MNRDIDSLDVDVDWLTVTTDTWPTTQPLRALADLYLYGENNPKPWRLLQYCGRTYHDPKGRGGVAYGERAGGNEAILQAWGALSSTIGRKLSTALIKPTRCDLQVTVLHSTAQPAVREMLETLPSQEHTYSAIVPMNNTGGTLYIGHRSSDRFGRLYDKGAQLGLDVPARTLWRYEVEYKRQMAAQVVAGLWGDSVSSGEKRAFIMQNVETFFREHGVPVPFSAGSDHYHSVVRYGTRQQDSLRTLKWLSQQVKPAVFRLALDGKADAVAEALGLGVVDGMPVFETAEVLPDSQLPLWLDT